MKTIQNIIPPVLSIAIFVVVAIVMSTIPSLNYEIDAYFWTQLIGSIIAMVMTFLVWSPTGENKGKLDKKYVANSKMYNSMANFIVQGQYFSKLGEFCVWKTEQNRLDIIKDRLAEHVIDFWIYEIYVHKEKTEEEKKRLEAVWGILSDKQKKVIEKLATTDVAHDILTPRDITMGRSNNRRLVNKNREQLYKYSHIALKSIWGIFTTCFTSFVVITPNDSFGIPQIVMITMWFFTFLMAIYSAIRIGYNSIAVYRNKYCQDQAELCAEFFAWANIQYVPPKVNETQQD